MKKVLSNEPKNSRIGQFKTKGGKRSDPVEDLGSSTLPYKQLER